MAGHKRDTCKKPREVQLHSEEGFLSSIIAQETALGSITCPWSIKALNSQRIKLSVMDFGVMMKKKKEETWTKMNYNVGNCPIFVYIVEQSSGDERRLSLCNDGVRERQLYTSSSNHVHIYFSILSHTPPEEIPYFLVKYKGICKVVLSLIKKEDNKASADKIAILVFAI